LPLYLQPAPIPKGWLRAIDDAMVCAHIGVADATDSYETAKKKLHDLIQWHIQVATDPTVNDGWQLVPIDPTEEMVDKGAQGMASFQEDSVWPNSWDAIQVKGMHHDAKKAYRYMLAAAPKPEDV